MLLNVSLQFLLIGFQALNLFLQLTDRFLNHPLVFTNDVLQRLLFTKYVSHFFKQMTPEEIVCAKMIKDTQLYCESGSIYFIPHLIETSSAGGSVS